MVHLTFGIHEVAFGYRPWTSYSQLLHFTFQIDAPPVSFRFLLPELSKTLPTSPHPSLALFWKTPTLPHVFWGPVTKNKSQKKEWLWPPNHGLIVFVTSDNCMALAVSLLESTHQKHAHYAPNPCTYPPPHTLCFREQNRLWRTWRRHVDNHVESAPHGAASCARPSPPAHRKSALRSSLVKRSLRTRPTASKRHSSLASGVLPCHGTWLEGLF